MADSPASRLYSASFAEHLRQPPPEFLYHYTSQDGLLGIIKSRSLWATNISYLNDATEFGLALALLRDRSLNEIHDRDTQAALFASSNPACANYPKKTKEQLQSLLRFAETQLSDICVTCFCKKGQSPKPMARI